MFPSIPYIPGYQPVRLPPLSRFLPPLPDGVVTQWLKDNLPNQDEDTSASWILDPFGASPNIAIEAARAGYRVLVASNNPIGRFLLEMAANPPTRAELIAILAELASAKKGDERIEPHIKSIYHTTCDQCNQKITADSFIWEKQAEGEHPILIARQYTCKHCGKTGEFPATNSDIELASQFSPTGIHYARALERVANKEDDYRQNAIEALSAYLPRSVYALFTLINKLDSFSLPSNQRRWLNALLLSACDYGSTLWPYPSARGRPRQLFMPSRFREHNIWFALEQAIDTWSKDETQNNQPIAIHVWPDIDIPTGNICVYEGRFKELAENLTQLPLKAIISAIPRPNQPFWTLSALWSGWLWGKEGVGPFKNVLRRRRYDWAWHRVAMQVIFENISKILTPDIPFVGLIGEVEPGFLSALFSAASNANLYLSGIAMRAESGQAQVVFNKSLTTSMSTTSKNTDFQQLSFSMISKDYSQEVMVKPAFEYLRLRGEPSTYLPLHAAMLSYLSHNQLLQILNARPSIDDSGSMNETSQSSHEELSQINNMLEQALSYRNGFLRFGGSEKSIEVGTWWFREQKMPEGFEVLSPQMDRVEMAIVRFLQNNPACTIQEIDKLICRNFPGLLTPSPELIQICLDSYGEQVPPESGQWYLRKEDEAAKRRLELSEMETLIKQIARSIGCRVEGQMPLIMIDDQGNSLYICHVIASGVISKILLAPNQNPQKSLLILPGSRANLVVYKIHHDPRLKQAVDSGWRFVKYRQLRLLSKSAIISTALLEEQLSKDLLTYNAPQLRLL